MQKAVKMSLKGKTLGNGQIMDRIFMILKNKMTPGVILTLPIYIYILYMNIIVKQIYWYLRSPVSVYRTTGPLV